MRKLSPFGIEVRKALLERGITVTDMTRELGFKSVKAVRDSLYGDRPGFKYRKKIIEFLSLDIKDDEKAAVNE